MKSYTDLTQSKKLAEILPLESADMCYRIVACNQNDTHEYQPYCFVSTLESDIPCWSLTALLNVLPRIEHLKPSIDLNPKLHSNDIAIYYYSEDSSYIVKDNLIDATFEMIIKLHELKLL